MRHLFTAAVTALALGGCALNHSPEQCLVKHEMAHAGGWPGDHPNSKFERGCGGLVMPPHQFPVRHKPRIHYVPRDQIIMHCGPGAQACTFFGDPATIYLPSD